MRQSRAINWTLKDIVTATSGQIVGSPENHDFSGISIDSRTAGPDDLFVAIKGDTHDGHNFVNEVIGQGIRGVVVGRQFMEQNGKIDWQDNQPGVCVVVNDTRKALGDLAAYHRKRAGVSVVAITGSNGKTTTRTMTTAVMARQFDTLSTQGNYNNDIGVPLTLLRLTQYHELAVVECGMNHPGEIRYLSGLCQPDIGIITNVAPAHLEGLGSVDAVARAKAELLEGINPNGTAVLNADDPRVLAMAEKTDRNVVFFGRKSPAIIRAESITLKDDGIEFQLCLPGDKVTCFLSIPATFLITNALAAAAAGYLMGLSGDEIARGLKAFRPAPGRMNLLTTPKDIHIIDDTYNANPGSMAAALSALSRLKGSGRGVVVVGDMYELGDFAKVMHQKLGQMAARVQVQRLYATGSWAETVANGARENGMEPDAIFTGSIPEIIQDLMDYLEPGDWVLVKGSRAMKMETVVHGMTQSLDSAP